MVKNYYILISICIMLLFVACKRQGEDNVHSTSNTAPRYEIEHSFPLKENGWPEENVMQINGRTYPLTDKEKIFHLEKKTPQNVLIEVNAEKTLEILLPDHSAVNKWILESKSGVSAKESFIIGKLKDEEVRDGAGPNLKKFEIKIEDDIDEILIKWVNVNEVEKEFCDMEEDYLIRIQIKR